MVVADTGPILNLTYADSLWLLPALFDELLIPMAVGDELAAYGVKIDELHWLIRRTAPEEMWRPLVGSSLQIGEAQAITLALQEGAGRILLDERAGRKAAVEAGLRTSGTLGVLAMAKREGAIAACKPVLDRCLIGAGAWFGQKLVREFLDSVGE